MSLADARLYLVSPTRLPAGSLARLIPDLVRAGVDVVQLREKEMEAGDLIGAGEEVADACRRARVPFIVNDRPDVALALGADGVHLGQNDLPVAVARRIVGDALVGLSTHAATEIDAVSRSRAVDYAAVGPVFATPTKPGRRAVGLELISYASAHLDLPWFAIGGIDERNLERVIAAGARRAVVVRAITQAADPVGAAATLKRMLSGVSLYSP